MRARLFHGGVASAVSVSLLVSGCATSHYRDAADKEAYGIVAEKADQVPGMESQFSIDTDATWDPVSELPVLEDGGRRFSENPDQELGYRVLSLEKALEIAVRNSRTYQDEKELLYLSALSLTLDRHQFGPRFFGGGRGDYGRSTTVREGASDLSNHVAGARQIAAGIDGLAGTPADLIAAYANVVESAGVVSGLDDTQNVFEHDRSVAGQTQLGMTHLLRGGGLFALTLTSNFLRFVTGDPGTATASTLAASFSQPLLAGRGAKIAAENLTQAERDVLYALRDYTRFRKVFIVRIVNSYYAVLERKDIARNNWQSYQSFLTSVKRETAHAREGRSTQADLGRLEQASLDNRNRWVASVQNYQEALDQFKIDLGLATDVALVLDDSELDYLVERGIVHPDISTEDAIEVALVSRLDYLTARDQVEDEARQVTVAADALKPGLDLILAANIDTIGQDNFQRLDVRTADWSAGLDLDLPLDRKSERNALRTALINQERSIRDYTLTEDSIKLDVRSGWRNLEQARLAYEIAEVSVELNKRRVREQEVLADVGRGTAINLVDAQNDLTSAQNDLTNTLIAHTIARLEFLRDMGILYIKENGGWEELYGDADEDVVDGVSEELVTEAAMVP